MQAQIEAMNAELAFEEQQIEVATKQGELREKQVQMDREAMAGSRKSDSNENARAQSAGGRQ